MLPQDVSSGGSANARPVAQAWDPYDVWLKRVKLPRERQPQRGPAPADIHAAPPSEARARGTPNDDPLLLPGIT